MSLRKPHTVVVSTDVGAEIPGADWNSALEYLPSIGSAYLCRRLREQQAAQVVPAECWPGDATATACWELCVPDDEYWRFTEMLGRSPTGEFPVTRTRP
ncbi:hypothetical protein [Nocardia sp. NBC_00511]|uniref:hypothetical protein n=1 Tax=Nocardia sp. NBC_00511 TaxID=2903591 RepID=UPI0030E253AE